MINSDPTLEEWFRFFLLIPGLLVLAPFLFLDAVIRWAIRRVRA